MGDVAEWLGRGLQSLAQGFDSPRRLDRTGSGPGDTPVGARSAPVRRGVMRAVLGQAVGVSAPDPRWSAPGNPPPYSAARPSGASFVQSAPLGGAAPVQQVPETRSERGELVLIGVLFVAALVTGASSLMPWRDYAYRYGTRVQETGWVGADGALGRGWVTVILAVLIAVSGVLIAAERVRAGQTLATLSGASLVLLAIAEWGLGAGDSRTGPGLGIWVELLVGTVVVIAVGALGTPRVRTARPPR